MISINTNIPSLIAQRSLNTSTKLLNQAIERMTTGFKINHASDNAANFSITTNMNTKLSSYQVAEDNVASGLDLLSTAGGSLDLISDKLTRLRALAEQASNGTYGEQSLKAIKSEANAIVDEIERIYSTAEYNGIKLFGESESKFIKPVEHRDTSSMTRLSDVDLTQSLSSGSYSISTAEELEMLANLWCTVSTDEHIEFVFANDIDLSAYTSNGGWNPHGFLESSATNSSITIDGNGYTISNLYINRPGSDNQGLFRDFMGISFQNLGLENVNITGNDYVGALAGRVGDAVSYKVSNCYVTGSISGKGSNVGILNGYGYAYIDSCLSEAEIMRTGTPVNEWTGDFILGSLRNGIIQTKRSPQQTLFQVGITGDNNSQISLETEFSLLGVGSLRSIGLGGNNLATIDNLINKISAKQTEYGATENRLESALEEISTQYDNLVSSRSTLRDADIAEVSSDYIRQQILQQASATLLATANQSPSLALQLI